MAALINDLRYGIRILVKTPGFTLVAIAALAVGIGANLTIFGFANDLLLRPLSIFEPERVIRAYSGTESNVRYDEYLQYRDPNQSMEKLAHERGIEVILRAGNSAPEHVRGF